MDLFTIAAKITADTTEFSKQIKNADNSGKNLASSLENAFSKVKKVIIGVASVAAVKKLTSDLFSLANATAEVGDKIDKQSQALGMSRQAYQEWDYILGQSGASIDSMGSSMKTLNEAILNGGKEAQAAMKEIGLSVQDLSKMSQEQAFEATVKALQKMPAGAQKSSLAMKLLGKNAQQLMPLLNSSAESVDQLKERAKELGLIMSDEAVDAAVLYGDSLDDLKRTFSSLKNTLGSQLLPKLTDGLIAVTNYAGKFSGYVRNAIDTGDWKGLFNNIIGDVKEAASLLWTRITDTVPELWQNAQAALLESDSPFLNVIGQLMSGITDAVKYIIDNKKQFENVFKTVSETISGIVTTGIETVKSVFQWLNDNGVTTQDIIKGIIAAFALSKLGTIASRLLSIKDNLLAISAVKIGGQGLGMLTASATVAAASVGAVQSAIEEIKEQHSILGINIDILWPEEERINKDAESVGDKIRQGVTGWVQQNGVWFTEYTQAIDKYVVKPAEEGWESVKEAATSIIESIKAGWGLFKLWFQNAVINPIKKKWDDITAKVGEIVDAVKEKWNVIVDWFQTNIIDPVKGKWDDITAKVSAVVGAVESLWASIVSWFQTNIIDPIASAWDNVTSKVETAIQKAKDFLGLGGPSEEGFNPDTTPLWDWTSHAAKPDGNAEGLPYVPYDNYLTRLHRGEMVLNRSRAERYRSGDGGMDINAFASAVLSAVKNGMEQANIQMNLNGEAVARNTGRIQAEAVKARRFAPV